MLTEIPKNVSTFFNSEERVLVCLNPYMLKFFVSIYTKHGAAILKEKTTHIPNLFNIALYLNLFLQQDKSNIKN